MRRPSFLALALLAFGGWGCSTDASGLGDELVDSSSSDDTSSSGDDTAVDEDTAALEDGAVDSSIVDSGVDSSVDSSAIDSVAADVTDSATADDGVDATDSAVVPDVVVSDSAPDTVVVDSPLDTGPVLVSTPGKVECSAGLCGKKYCCGAPKLTGGYDWQCVDNCGFFGVGAIDYACDEKADCSGSQVCCVNTALSAWVGSSCRSSCGGDPQLCLTNAECPTGKTCTPTSVPSSSFSFATCK